MPVKIWKYLLCFKKIYVTSSVVQKLLNDKEQNKKPVFCLIFTYSHISVTSVFSLNVDAFGDL